MKTFSVLLAYCAGNSSVTGEFPAQRPVTRSFDVFFDLRPNKWLSIQWRRWWFETPSRSLWRHCNEFDCFPTMVYRITTKNTRHRIIGLRVESALVTGAFPRKGPVMRLFVLFALFCFICILSILNGSDLTIYYIFSILNLSVIRFSTHKSWLSFSRLCFIVSMAISNFVYHFAEQAILLKLPLEVI